MSSSGSRRRGPALQRSIFTGMALCAVVSADCAPRPIAISLGNVTISNQKVIRGLDISIGSPQQSLAFLPQWSLNHTFVYGTNGFCNGYSSVACETYRGGRYDQFASQTAGRVSPGLTPNDAPPYPELSWVSENVTLGKTVALEKFPVGVALSGWGNQGYHHQAAMGLGANSTMLRSLKSAGRIASRSWGMFWGRTGATKGSQLDGGVVLGGYDRAKVSGQNYTYNLDNSNAECPTSMLVTVSAMTLNFANGSAVSMFDGTESLPFSACIVPDAPVLMTMPYEPTFRRFQNLTRAPYLGRSHGIYYYGMIYDNPESQIYTGDITITLNSEVAIRIPSDQLVVPDLTIDNMTGALMANASRMEVLLDPLIENGKKGTLPRIGRQFLSSAYVMVNQDAGQFTLWSASPTARQDLVAIDSSNHVNSDFCREPSAPDSTAKTGAGSGSRRKISSGVIVGITIGVTVAVSCLGWLIFFCFMQRRNQARTKADTPRVELEENARGYAPRPSISQAPRELDGRRSVPGAVQPVELPARTARD
ncbi:hypothetical protein LOZ57_002698 [Ophidiomyces ophidiicola]|uniref:uncharacterized protein n=1 Tax=Ophidiomyces ophidiicola TaxID=1387563 RepID=UPI0020C4EC06|nr:uncharacterized protein LOZ57_002698 [Ophidiomyces ophidiicola]KAI1948347.1 hypothetical protein LOZ57_002698 [Ophidiomyces ophidiicola]KAI2048576.1 hypothetical protein LOZ43_005369 [Ophidiomyces ophidiicola]